MAAIQGQSLAGEWVSQLTWRNANAIGAALSVVLWVAATITDWINSVRFVSHISMLALVISFIAAWRADVPDNEGTP